LEDFSAEEEYSASATSFFRSKPCESQSAPQMLMMMPMAR
jgi:hypothetical protein